MIVEMLITAYRIEVAEQIQICMICLLQRAVIGLGRIAPIVLASPLVEFQMTGARRTESVSKKV